MDLNVINFGLINSVMVVIIRIWMVVISIWTETSI